MDSELCSTLDHAAALLRLHPDLPQPISVSATESQEVWLMLWNPLADCKAVLRWHDAMELPDRESFAVSDEVTHLTVRGTLDGVRIVVQASTTTKIASTGNLSEDQLRDAAATEEPIW